MSDKHTDLVIQISTSASASNEANHDLAGAEESRLTTELRQCLQPGLEVALFFHGCMAITSILWLSELQRDRSFRVGIRLFGVSALPEHERPEPWARNRVVSGESG